MASVSYKYLALTNEFDHVTHLLSSIINLNLCRFAAWCSDHLYQRLTAGVITRCPTTTYGQRLWSLQPSGFWWGII